MTMLAVLGSFQSSRSRSWSDDAARGSRMPRPDVSADFTPSAVAKLSKASLSTTDTDNVFAIHSELDHICRHNRYSTSRQIRSSPPATTSPAMPPVRTARASRKAPPEGFDDIEDTLLEFQNKMKDAENASHEGKKKYEMTWPIFQITHQRSRYIYDLYYEKEAISKQLYDYLLKNGYADAMLIAKWKKQGYEKVSPSFTGNFPGNFPARIGLTRE